MEESTSTTYLTSTYKKDLITCLEKPITQKSFYALHEITKAESKSFHVMAEDFRHFMKCQVKQPFLKKTKTISCYAE